MIVDGIKKKNQAKAAAATRAANKKAKEDAKEESFHHPISARSTKSNRS